MSSEQGLPSASVNRQPVNIGTGAVSLNTHLRTSRRENPDRDLHRVSRTCRDFEKVCQAFHEGPQGTTCQPVSCARRDDAKTMQELLRRVARTIRLS